MLLPLPGLPRVSSHLPNNRIFLKGRQASEILISDIRIVVRIGNNSQGSSFAYPLPGLPRDPSHLPNNWIFLKGPQEGSPLAYPLPGLPRVSSHLPKDRIFLKGPQEGSPLAYPLSRLAKRSFSFSNSPLDNLKYPNPVCSDMRTINRTRFNRRNFSRYIIEKVVNPQ